MAQKAAENLFHSDGDEVCCVDRFLGDEVVAELATLLSTDKTKRKLILRGNCIGEKGAQAIGEMVRSNITLEQISLDWNLISSSGSIHISKGIEVNVSVVQLDLRNNSIDDEGAIDLAEGLKNNSVLKTIDLRWNQIGDRGAHALLETLQSRDNALMIQLHGNPVSTQLLEKFEHYKDVKEPIAVEEPIVPTEPHVIPHSDGYVESLLKENAALRAQCISAQALSNDQQRQLDTSALKIVELEQEADRNKFTFEQLNEEICHHKVRISQMTDEQDLFKQSISRERRELLDQVKNITKLREIDRHTHEADMEALKSRIKTLEESHDVIEDLLEASRNKLKLDADMWERKWREEQQKAFDSLQVSKDAKQEALEFKDELENSRRMVAHFEGMVASYDKRIEELNATHSKQMHTVMEHHQTEMNEFGVISTAQSKKIAELQDQISALDSKIAKMEIDKIHECEQISLNEREAAQKRYAGQLAELRNRMEAYITSKTIAEEKCAELTQELNTLNGEYEAFCTEMKESRLSLLSENSALKEKLGDLKTEQTSKKGEISQLKSEVDMLTQKLEDYDMEKKEVYASLQDSIKDRQKLLELTEKLKNKLDQMTRNRVDEFERVERSVTSAMQKEFESMKLQLKLVHKPSKKQPLGEQGGMSRGNSTANLHNESMSSM